ncbi:ATP-binding protein [Jeotgalibacillus sp. R-1-5s-1]|uniref:ATP-binding protein n=1 Tax=Jeotgalibacillus sp. R-1-5s-1 TaxID=2555897 RepID=UPI00106B29E1|nr:ATP-binding protein [Jeotgalibacillus sp. R-1-5s-1]TFD95774.1 ATP-binding protein [Jeotgalibacillus sp. R-1-5s-1]
MNWLSFSVIRKLRQSIFPFSPSEQSVDHLLYRIKAGFLAMQCGKKLGSTKQQQDELFYDALVQSPDSLLQSKDPLYSAVAQMIEWESAEVDLPEKISNYHVPDDLKKAMLDVYFETKHELFPSGKPGVSVTSVPDSWEIYRDVIYAATQEKLLLIRKEEIEFYKTGEVLLEYMIRKRSDIADVRNMARQCFEDRGYSKSVMMSCLLALSEALTNVFKHAKHGSMKLVEDDHLSLHFIIEDQGPGIALENLPKATLLNGFSTGKSLGQGFNVMLKVASKLRLYTDNQGTSLIISFDQPMDKEKDSDRQNDQYSALPHY